MEARSGGGGEAACARCARARARRRAPHRWPQRLAMAQPVDATLNEVETALASLEAALAPLLRSPQGLPALAADAAPLDSARLHGCLASTTAVLLACYLRLSGVDTGTHAIAQDFAALQRLGARVKQVAAALQREEEEGRAEGGAGGGGGGGGGGAQGGVGQPRDAPSTVVNVAASKRFLKAALGAGR